MGKDWNEPRDKGPTIEEPNRHRSKKSKKKPFVLEHRYIGPPRKYRTQYYEQHREWSVYQRYATERGREQAFAALEHKRKNSYRVFTFWEYRIP